MPKKTSPTVAAFVALESRLIEAGADAGAIVTQTAELLNVPRSSYYEWRSGRSSAPGAVCRLADVLATQSTPNLRAIRAQFAACVPLMAGNE